MMDTDFESVLDGMIDSAAADGQVRGASAVGPVTFDDLNEQEQALFTGIQTRRAKLLTLPQDRLTVADWQKMGVDETTRKRLNSAFASQGVLLSIGGARGKGAHNPKLIGKWWLKEVKPTPKA